MSLRSLTSFSRPNRRQIALLVGSHLLWSVAVCALWWGGRLPLTGGPWWAGAFAAVQFYAAAQLLLPALRLHPEERTRAFYLFWGLALAFAVGLLHRIPADGPWQVPLTALRSGALLLAATVTGAALARYVHRLWEIVPICLAMTLADFASWLYGPTAAFTRQIELYYRAPEGPAPLVDMLLVKLAFPAPVGLAPVFGISDWIMAVFFAIVARRHGVNDNLLGPPGEVLASRGGCGRYLPVPVAALFAAVVLAQATGLFLPALPMIALIMLLWYGARRLRRAGRP